MKCFAINVASVGVMDKIKTDTRWVVTAPWYDSGNQFCGRDHRLRADAIAAFMENWPQGPSWRAFKRKGWRCTKATINWT